MSGGNWQHLGHAPDPNWRKDIPVEEERTDADCLLDNQDLRQEIVLALNRERKAKARKRRRFSWRTASR